MAPGSSPTSVGGARPAISVVTVVFNGHDQFERTMASVRSQTHAGIEYIVVDGGSSDGTPDIVQKHRRSIDHFVSEPDRGTYDAMNKAFALASGEFLLFMNCGDVFADAESVSRLLQQAVPGREQVLFGGWIRRGDPGGDRPCRPSLERGLFNHQAIAYSRSIHSWHGGYAVVPGLTAADYLFFATLMASDRVACRTIDDPVAIIDVHGVSAGLQTFSQKHAIDYLCGRTNRWKLIAVLALHPLYHRLKRLWGRLR